MHANILVHQKSEESAQSFSASLCTIQYMAQATAAKTNIQYWQKPFYLRFYDLLFTIEITPLMQKDHRAVFQYIQK